MNIIAVRLRRNHSARLRHFLAKEGFAIFKTEILTREISRDDESEKDIDGSLDEIVYLDEGTCFYECIYNGQHWPESFYEIIEKLENGLTVMIIPKKGIKKKYAIWGTFYGSNNNKFVGFSIKGDVSLSSPGFTKAIYGVTFSFKL